MPYTYTKNTKKESDEKRLFNIKAFSSLDRTGLSFNGIQRRLLMHTLETGEKLYIQYPGKESIATKIRPWDFRPKLQKADGSWLNDLSFKDIWDDLYKLKDIKTDMSLIASLFFKMAFMIDTTKTTKTLPFEDIDQTGTVVNTGAIDFTYYEYTPSQKSLDDLKLSKSDLRDVSLLAYLLCNDYLVQNEDCKYYYRAIYEDKTKWDTKIGRHNTLLTHMSVIAFIEKKLRFTEIMDMFQRGRGVAPLSSKKWEDVTNGKIIKK